MAENRNPGKRKYRKTVFEAEGSGRVAKNDQLRFFHIAMGSIREVQAVVDLYTEQFSPAEKDQLDNLAASSFKLIRTASR